MIFSEPDIDVADHDVLDLIENQRKRLALHTQHSPRRWTGSLRRQTFARAIQGSNSIEGYNATLDEAIAAIADEPPADERTETWFAINGYRAAMTYVMQAARDPYFEFSKQFLKSLHFMMIGHDMTKNPGQWRPGAIRVVNEQTGEQVYEGPDVEIVDALISELVEYVRDATTRGQLIKASIAHLNLAMIHPFSDGNGRMARALQTLVLASDGLLNPVYSSIEEWLGRNTNEYYAVLSETGQGEWTPQNPTLKWVRFCLKAHYQQAATLIRRSEEYGDLFNKIEEIIAREKLDERVAVPLFDSALGLRLTNARYQEDADVSLNIAWRDLRKLSDLGLLKPQGATKGRWYAAGQELVEVRNLVRINRPLEDPYQIVSS